MRGGYDGRAVRGREAARERNAERWNAVGARGAQDSASSVRKPVARGRAVRSSATGGATRRSASAGVRAQARECGRAGARRGPGLARRLLGQGEARKQASAVRRARGLCWAGLRGWAESEAAARENRKTLFHLYFQELFKGQLLNIILSKKMTSFENVPKMKVV